MKSLTKYVCVKKAQKLTALLLIALIVFTFSVWTLKSDRAWYRSQSSRLILPFQTRKDYFSLQGSTFNTSQNATTRSETTGFDRALRVQHLCEKYKQTVCRHENPKAAYCSSSSSKSRTIRVDYNRNRRAMFCPMCKVASTFWTRVFRMFTINDKGHSGKPLLTPYDVPISDAPASKLHFDTINQVVTPRDKVDFKFLFVRDPFSMLFSTYVDKIIGPNPVYWKQFGVEATGRLRKEKSKVCGADVTFKEFLDHVIHTFKSRKNLDCHFAKFSNCQPCNVKYDFIGTMESFKKDTNTLLKVFNQTKTINIFKERFGDLHALDAVEDSVTGPFEWKTDIVKCMPWHQALHRIWRKLQLRGVIGTSEFPLSPRESGTISRTDFIQLLISTRKDSDSVERSAIKKQAYVEAYKDISDDLLHDIRTVYKEEFELFGYEFSPLNENTEYSAFQPFNGSLLDLSSR